ncbi:MAG: 2TM domain-containing protein [Deltaproteobacteria bacterium]|nr:2TM domain-containing protein [Deltaproteobacteria bacterium]
MKNRATPSRAFAIRDEHRSLLTLHFILYIAGCGALFVINRFTSPETLWAHWFALAWGVIFMTHLWRFARATLRTMGPGAPRRDSAED